MVNFLYYFEILLSSYLALILALYIMSTRIQAAGFFARLLASYISLLICACYGVIASIFLRFTGYGRIAQWATARSFKFVMWYTTGVTFTIEDPNNYLKTTRPAVFIGNHQSELDVLMLACVFPRYCSVTAKSSLKRMPFLGWFMALSRTVFIDRKNSTSARQAMAGAAEEITGQRQSVYIFPEGTRSYAKEPMLLPFKKGAFHLAVQAGVPIVPVVAATYSDILYVQGRKFTSGSIPVKVLKPIETKDLTPSDVEDLTRDTRELMLKEIIELTARTRNRTSNSLAHKSQNGVTKASGVKIPAS